MQDFFLQVYRTLSAVLWGIYDDNNAKGNVRSVGQTTYIYIYNTAI